MPFDSDAQREGFFATHRSGNEPQPRRVPLASIKPPGRDLNLTMNPLADRVTGLVKDYTGKATVPRTSGFRRAWTESPRYGGVILRVEDNNGQTWSLYDQSDEADADGWEANAKEYWSCIETQGWSLESEPVSWLQVAKTNQDVTDADLKGLADQTARDLDFEDDAEPEAFLADVEEILQDMTPALKASEYDAVRPVEDKFADAGGGEA
ncbi:MAG: hypothetical protein LC623_02235 [Halobacteriales archaeon]|nr:hypothetical protein [Halobacteriales archaeon]